VTPERQEEERVAETKQRGCANCGNGTAGTPGDGFLERAWPCGHAYCYLCHDRGRDEDCARGECEDAPRAGRRYFVGIDSSSHRYLVPVERAKDWRAWTEMPDDDEDAWDVPEYAERLDGGTLTFSEPKVESRS
jgi:hypothetical protein